jgi:predicted RNase H-like HicB family nuclease
MAKITFHVVVNEEDDGSYWAEVEELPGCFASGFSLDELKEAAVEAMQLWLPKGIELENAKWTVVNEKQSERGKSQLGRRQMLVTA